MTSLRWLGAAALTLAAAWSATFGCSSGTSGSGSTSASSAVGSGGSTTTGGAGPGGAGGAGAGGGPIAAPECTESSQCQVVNDCCVCESIPAKEKPMACAKQCIISTCASKQLMNPEASCEAGRCVLFNCDHSKVLCKSLPPTCPAGETPSVNESCWGGCVKATECKTVSDCKQCDASTQACVTYVAMIGPQRHCVETPAACQGKPTCACMGASVCVGLYKSCGDGNGLSCSCPNC